MSLEFVIDIILPVALWPLGRLSLITEMSTRNISWGKRWLVRKADNLTTFMCRLIRNSGNLNLLETPGLVQGFLYLLPFPPYILFKGVISVLNLRVS